MSTPTIEGKGNLPARPTLAYLNRTDLRIVQALEAAMGGRIAWLVEHNHMPGSAVMSYLHKPGTSGILANINNMSRELLADYVHDKLKAGFHVVLITGRPTQAKGSLADVPARLLSFLDDTTLPVLPIYAGYSQEDVEDALPEHAAEAPLYLRFMPQQREGKAMSARVRAAWMEAQADHLAAHPLLREASLPRLLVTALMRHQGGRLIDGVDDSTLSYRNLLARALMLAVRLREHTKNRRLGIILPPGKLATIANLACLLAGISPVNLNYTADHANTEREIRQSGVNRFLTEERFRRKLSRFAWPSSRDLLYVDTELREMGRAPFTMWRFLVRMGSPERVLRRLKLPTAAPDDEATLFFTAGVEGSPHAIPVSHRMLLASLLQLHARLDIRAGQRVLSALPHHTPLGFVHGLLLPLLFGCDMVTYPSPTASLRLLSLMGQNKVRLAVATPGMLRGMLQACSEENRQKLTTQAPILARQLRNTNLPELLAALRYLIIGGSDLTEALEQNARALLGVQVLGAYSLAEAAPLAALNLPPCEGGLADAEGSQMPTIPSHRRGSVGAPLPGIAVRITDVAREGRMLPPRSPGLIWLKGANLASRYLDEEEGLLRGQWYCTGDVGYVDEEGMLFISGRKMRFSKIGGELVPHEQLEAVLASMYKVPEAEIRQKLAIVAVPDPKEGEQLVLLSAVHKSNADYRYTTMRYNLMNAGYPEQWTPKRLIPMSFIPLMPDGKLNYPLCFYGLCRQLNIALPGQED